VEDGVWGSIERKSRLQEVIRESAGGKCDEGNGQGGRGDGCSGLGCD
jgi:hypothetical protein